MSEYTPTEYVVDFGDYRSNRFVELSMALIEHNGAKLHERIVRCKDCVWYQPWRTFAGEQENEGVCNMTHNGVGEDGFCAWRERQEQ